MKNCSVCGKPKSDAEFGVRKASKDGLTAACKECLRIRDQERYPKEKEYRSEKQKIYMQSKNGKESHAESVQKWKRSNAIKRAAHVILNNAIRDGKVTPLPCFICGARAEAHHPDYDRPLDVVWLCSTHHKQAHSLMS